MNRNRVNNKHVRISQTFQRWLFVVVTIAFLFTTAFLWFFQTRLSQQNAIELLSLNISDVRQDIIDASDENLLERAALVAEEINNNAAPDSAFLLDMIVKYNLAEANIIDSDGIITATTYKPFLNYDMASGTQSAEFMVLLQGQTEYAQSYQPTSYDPQILRKYGGVVLEGGGFVQVGYDSGRFQRDIDSLVVGLTRNRHVGEAGSIIIADEDFKIVSDRHDNEGRGLRITGLTFDPETIEENEPFTAEVYGESCYCMYVHTEGYYIIAVLPQKEAVLSRNVSVGITTAMELIVFAALFLLIYILIKKLIVDNIHRINHSLSEITDGNLDVTVDVRSNEEFSSLSDDINSTVDTLKRYIADAAARIDAELEFARAIQHSSLPSVFPPYPGRKEFELFASMRTAKEVGGDFYDFYLIDDKTLAFLIADVSGKGIPAAMFMMTVKTLIKSLAESGMAVHDVFTEANEKLSANNDAGMFVTAWMGILNTKTGVVTYANAGHNPPLIKRADGNFEYLKTRAGFVLAGMEGVRYKQQELRLEKGDTIYLYTDGVTEAANTDNELFGETRLQTVLNITANGKPEQLLQSVTDSLADFVGNAAQSDDITMLCLQYAKEEHA